MSTRLTADPNGASYALEHRGAMRGRFSDRFILVGHEASAGYSLMLEPLFELHQPRDTDYVLPSQYWRARLSLGQSYGFLRGRTLLKLGLWLTHESDHETAHANARPGFLVLNDIALRVQVSQRGTLVAWYAVLDTRLYALSCTLPSRPCENFGGDASFGGQLQFGVVGLRTLWSLAPFAAASISGIVPHGKLIAERRALLHLGIYKELGRSVFSLYAVGSIGSDVGIVRNRRLDVIGAGLSFAR